MNDLFDLNACDEKDEIGSDSSLESDEIFNENSPLKESLTYALLQNHFDNCTNDKHPRKITREANQLATAYLRLFIIEGYKRAANEAKLAGDNILMPEHIEKIMAQLLLDF
mmetsp:Transcript_5020/g.7150  ORF Transcript_5020/g.7150 Transcript_5020/m.7150 type:complete len:111 (-) Transcript_5020:63-395(-)